jgi:peptidoglycan/LPS O-acetylase OafA/YrhL/lysophospholipase L1-like esterase
MSSDAADTGPGNQVRVPPPVQLRIDGIDGLRALCVAAVLAYHLELPVFAGGFLGVEVFFVVSGYLITSLLIREQEHSNKIDLKRFWSRRLRRLLPAVLGLLVFVAILVPAFAPDAAQSFRHDTVGALLYISNWWQLWFGQSYFEAALRPPLLRHLWSLAVEEQFYLIWPIAMLGLVKVPRKIAAVLLAGFATLSSTLMWLLHDNSRDGTRAYVGTDTRAFGLLIGAMLAFTISANSKILRGRVAASIVGLAGVLTIAWTTWSLSPDTKWLFPFGFLLVDFATIATLISVTSPDEKWLGRALGNPVLRWLGTRSYSLYLFHFPIFQIMRPRVDVGNHWWINPLRVGISLVFAELSYRIIEAPFRKLGLTAITRRLGRRIVPIALLCALMVAYAGYGVWHTETLNLNAAPNAKIVQDTSPIAAQDVSALPRTTIPSTPTNTLDRTAASSPDGGTTSVPIPVQNTPTIPVAPTTPPPTYPPLTTLVPPSTSILGVPFTTLPPEPSRILAIGDSVMLGAGPQLNRAFGQQLQLDAVESRAWAAVPTELTQYDVLNNPPKVLILHLGNNGAPEDGTIKQVIRQAANTPYIVVVTVALPRRWESETNKRLNAILKLRPDIRIADWHTYSTGQRGWFERDGFHLNEPGRFAYAEMLRVVLADVVPSVPATSAASKSPTTSTTTTTSTVPESTTSIVEPTTVPPTKLSGTIKKKSKPQPSSTPSQTGIPESTGLAPPTSSPAPAPIQPEATAPPDQPAPTAASAG